MGAPPSFGAALIGFGAACFLCGSMLVQMYIYIKSEAARTDNWKFKAMVGGLWIIDMAQLIFLGAYVYGDLIVHFDNAFFLGVGPWPFAVVTALSVWVSTPVQLFYAWRVFILGHRRWFLPSLIAVMSLLSFSCGMATAILADKVRLFVHYDSFLPVVDTWLAADIITDVLIVGSLYYFLTRGRTGFSQTDMIIDKLVFLVINTGLAPTLMEAAHLISFSVAPESFAHLSFNFIVPKLYANSFMATLNARNYILSSSQKVSVASMAGTNRRELERYEMPSFTTSQGGRRVGGTGPEVLDIKITTIQEQSREYDYQHDAGSDHSNPKLYPQGGAKYGAAV